MAYCASCGVEIDESVQYCPSCGHGIGSTPTPHEEIDSAVEKVDRDDSDVSDGADYDFVMSIEDAIRRRTPLRLILDVIALLVTAGFWAGWLIIEVIQHHYKLKKGESKPYEGGDEKSFNIL